METQTETADWLTKEEEILEQTKPKDYIKLPSIKLVQDDIVEVDIDFSKPFDKWEDKENKVTKAIIPVTQDKEQRLWWLNVKNPVYIEIVRAGRTGQTHFKVLQTGSKKETKYKLK
jgi:hypothetical protein